MTHASEKCRCPSSEPSSYSGKVSRVKRRHAGRYCSPRRNAGKTPLKAVDTSAAWSWRTGHSPAHNCFSREGRAERDFAGLIGEEVVAFRYHRPLYTCDRHNDVELGDAPVVCNCTSGATCPCHPGRAREYNLDWPSKVTWDLWVPGLSILAIRIIV
jgi:hypothetical protein